MKSLIISYVSGLIFAVGLALSGMTQPSKVIGFLDIAGNWDPSLILVMGGAIAIYMLAYWVLRPRATKRAGSVIVLSSRRDIDTPLIAGAALFGLGWGIAGLCPGPAVTSLASGQTSILLFVGAMLGGMYLFTLLPDVRRTLVSVAFPERQSAVNM